MKKFGIFHKVFAYTTLFLVAVIAIAFGLFYQQFVAFYTAQQTQQLRVNYQTLYEELLGADRQQMLEIAQNFFDDNQTFVFQIMDEGDNVLFFTPNMREQTEGSGTRILLSFNDYTLVAQNPAPQIAGSGFWSTAAVGLSAIMAIALLGAFLFARQMTKPIKNLVTDTKKMSKLLPIEPPERRNDEIGELAHDVHNMYGKLKDTIDMLEEENTRRKEMEESQRYFFSAASHELKTPIAATRLVLEGMLAGVGDYGNHPKYLNECIKLMDEQSKTIYEILDIVDLNEQLAQNPESINIKEMVEGLFETYKPLIQASGQVVELDLAETLTSYADAHLLKKALSNVILNAVQNAPQSGNIKVYTERALEGTRLCVLNAGEIDEQHLPRLFDPFYRMDKARNRKSGRTGLGLTIVKKSLDLMDTQFGLENVTAGVLFWMVLPMETFE